MRASAKVAARGAAVLLILAAAGCRPPVTKLRVESHRPGEPPRELVETFDTCAFYWNNRGDLDLVLRRRQPSAVEADAEMVQVFWAHVLWKPVPGTTYAERTQTNATFVYALLDADRAISYEGAGFLYLTLDRSERTLTGAVESGTLAPVRRSGDAVDLLGQCLISGEFEARRDARTVVATLEELRRRLGPPPRYQPQESGPEVR
jgi:hypothetical protein